MLAIMDIETMRRTRLEGGAPQIFKLLLNDSAVNPAVWARVGVACSSEEIEPSLAFPRKVGGPQERTKPELSLS